MKSAPYLLPMLLLLAVVFPAASGLAAGVKDSPHNLSAGSAARIKSDTEERICIFCHTPHHATLHSDPEYPGPLWSRQENVETYATYDSATIISKPGQPQGPSRLCLSCHDGTIALGNVHASGLQVETLSTFPPPAWPQRTAVLGTNLGDDHPISMEYGVRPGEFNDPETLRLKRIRLSYRSGVPHVECTSCHDPHDNQYGNFMVMDTSQQADVLCTACHIRSGWSGSAHQTGGTQYAEGIPEAVAKNGCANCHLPHGAQHGEDLLQLSDEVGAGIDSNCLASCHNDSPYRNIRAEFERSYGHPLTWDSGGNAHSAIEVLPLAAGRKHVHCVDCHNPHQALWAATPLDETKTLWEDPPPDATGAPAAPAVLQGARGVADNGDMVVPAAFEYQVCFGCHSGIDARAGEFHDRTLASRPVRMFESFDQAERFSASAVSAHPVVAVGGAGESLLTGAKTGQIYCSSCHQPHGASEQHMLRAANPATFPNVEGTSFPLCFGCHSEDYLMGNALASAPLHSRHVIDHQVPCSVCHDPHGVPFLAGLTTSDNARRLVNFDRRYVQYDQDNPNDPANARYSAGPPPSCFNLQNPGSEGLSCHPSSMPNPASY